MIPKRLHRIWFGRRRRPAVYERYWDDWQYLHPDWELTTWTEENLPRLVNQHLFDAVRQTARSGGIPMAHERAVAVQQADIAAYELVWRYGGVYVNCDMQPIRPLDPLLEHKNFAAMEDERYVCNAVMGGETHSLFYREVVKSLAGRFARWPGAGMEIQTGPHALTDVVDRYPDEITILPREAFYFAHHGFLQFGQDASGFVDQARDAGAYALHHWGHRTQEGDR